MHCLSRQFRGKVRIPQGSLMTICYGLANERCPAGEKVFFPLFMKGTTIGRMAYLWEKCEIAEISLIKGAGYY
jgi:hypothetical protein